MQCCSPWCNANDHSWCNALAFCPVFPQCSSVLHYLLVTLQMMLSVMLFNYKATLVVMSSITYINLTQRDLILTSNAPIVRVNKISHQIHRWLASVYKSLWEIKTLGALLTDQKRSARWCVACNSPRYHVDIWGLGFSAPMESLRVLSVRETACRWTGHGGRGGAALQEDKTWACWLLLLFLFTFRLFHRHVWSGYVEWFQRGGSLALPGPGVAARLTSAVGSRLSSSLVSSSVSWDVQCRLDRWLWNTQCLCVSTFKPDRK